MLELEMNNTYYNMELENAEKFLRNCNKNLVAIVCCEEMELFEDYLTVSELLYKVNNYLD